ncbi:hypothetical protein [Leeuwenhoekiella marinoflava]|uniref:ArnT family glycosyltransferase n=1 Tax=Leeuwenhoekiella marinoflava TaxID=988 RepID=UPI0030038281
MKISEKYYPLILVAACLFLFFPHLDVLYANIMEARNFNTAREMLEHNNWVLTTMNGEARYEKPPLPTWLVAFSAGVFGITKLWALRLPSALISTVLVLFSFSLSRKRMQLSAKQSLYGSFILATSFYILFAGRNGTWDIFAHAFMLGGIYFLFQFFTTESKIYQNAALAGLFIGLSFMSKGPVSHFALLLPFLIAYIAVFKLKTFRSRTVPFILLVLITLVLSSWWALAIYFGDSETATAIADKETMAWANRNTRAFYYYWSFFTQSGTWTIPAFVSLLYPYLKSRCSNLKMYRFSLIWTLAAVVLLSCIPEKKSRYLLPVLIPLALNTSFYIEYLVRAFKVLKDKRETVPVYFNFGIIGLVCFLTPIAGYLVLSSNLDGLYFWYISLSLVLLITGVFIFKYLAKRKIERVFFLVIGFTCAVITFGFPLVRASYTNEDYAQLAPKVQQLLSEEKQLYLFENSSPELIWDLGQRVPVLNTREGLHLPTQTPFYLILEEERQEELKELLDGFNMTLEGCYDGNITTKADRNYKTRRVGCLYLVSKAN